MRPAFCNAAQISLIQKLSVVLQPRLGWVSVEDVSFSFIRHQVSNPFVFVCVCVQQFPYQVRLSIASGSTTYLCGGTIVSTSLVVTAAHCVTSSTASTSSPVFLSGISVTAIAGQIDRSTTPSTMQTRTVCQFGTDFWHKKEWTLLAFTRPECTARRRATCWCTRATARTHTSTTWPSCTSRHRSISPVQSARSRCLRRAPPSRVGWYAPLAASAIPATVRGRRLKRVALDDHSCAHSNYDWSHSDSALKY